MLFTSLSKQLCAIADIAGIRLTVWSIAHWQLSKCEEIALQTVRPVRRFTILVLQAKSVCNTDTVFSTAA
jgi:hypothetical protein